TVLSMRKDYNHDGARPWRGVKRDNWEGGHRVPFIARWPGKIKPGTISSQIISLTDLMATFAAITNVKMPIGAGEDSVNMLSALLGDDNGKSIREYTLHQTISLALAIRRGPWKFLDHKGSGGNNYNRVGRWGMKDYIIPEKSPNAPGQLYNLDTDPGESNNLYFQKPEIVKELKNKLEEFKKSGRSAPL
ncbi:MAG: sulfatase-like hydrolase/transferase, partial [Verrucomicrobiota bacterium]|nr:sulfatase-like hydrolase/transferase [Verrucomicrobiota bacterium]